MNDKKGGWITLKDGRRIYINNYMNDKIRSGANKELKKLQAEYDSIKNMFDPRKAELRNKIDALKEGKSLEDYKNEKKAKEENYKKENLLEKQKRLSGETANRKDLEEKYKNIKVREINEEDLKEPQKGYVRIYRGLKNEFDKAYDRSKIDNSNNYESWTDNYELAKAYGDNVYFMDIKKENISNDIFDKDGYRHFAYEHNKPVGINGKTGKEIMLYTDHDDYLNSAVYTKINKKKNRK